MDLNAIIMNITSTVGAMVTVICYTKIWKLRNAKTRISKLTLNTIIAEALALTIILIFTILALIGQLKLISEILHNSMRLMIFIPSIIFNYRMVSHIIELEKQFGDYIQELEELKENNEEMVTIEQQIIDAIINNETNSSETSK